MTEEYTETVELSDQDVADLARLHAEPDGDDAPPSFHTVLEVWREVLKPAAEEAVKDVTPQWANRICSSYQQVTFADMERFRDLYFTRLALLLDVVAAEISSDEDCLTWTTPEEDVEHNGGHYKTILIDWQVVILNWELAWRCTDPDAAVDLAAISEIHKMFFGPTGLTAFLDNIKFEFTEADQAELAAALDELREG